MKIKVLAILTVTAMCVSLCSCGGQIETNSRGKDVELGASPSSEPATSSASETVTQFGSGTGTTVKKADGESDQTTVVKQTTTTRALEVLHRGNSTWKEIPINEGALVSTAIFRDFDLRDTITTADYVFSGTIISRKEYVISWVDKYGELHGSIKKAILEVKINHTYHGKSPVKGNIIKVLYPDSLSIAYKGVALAKDQGEYVFVTWVLDENYVKLREKESPLDGTEVEKYADVYMGTPRYTLLPIEKGNVLAYKGYFDWNKDIMSKAKPSVKTDKISYGQSDPLFVALDKKDFDTAFVQLFENPQILPTASTLSTTTSQVQ